MFPQNMNLFSWYPGYIVYFKCGHVSKLWNRSQPCIKALIQGSCHVPKLWYTTRNENTMVIPKKLPFGSTSAPAQPCSRIFSLEKCPKILELGRFEVDDDPTKNHFQISIIQQYDLNRILYCYERILIKNYHHCNLNPSSSIKFNKYLNRILYC